MFALLGCSSSNDTTQNDIVTQYYDYAQTCIEQGDIEKSKDALEEGIANTGSEKLQNLLNELNKKAESEQTEQKEEAKQEDSDKKEENNSSESDSSVPTVSTSDNNKPTKTAGKIAELWCGWWRTVDSSIDGGGGFYVSCDYNYIDETLWFNVESVSSPPANRVASFEVEVSAIELQNDQLLIEFDEDGWGTSGKCLLTHNGVTITCKIYDVVSGNQNWGFTEGEYELICF